MESISCRRVISVLLLLLPSLAGVAGTLPAIARAAGDESTSAVMRLERDRLFLNSLDFVQPGLSSLFDLNTTSGQLQAEAVKARLETMEKASTAPQLLARWVPFAVNGLLQLDVWQKIDASEPKLRHFFDLNRNHYPARDMVSGYRVVIPRSLAADSGTTLAEIGSRLSGPDFPSEAYRINDSVGRPGTGFFTSSSEELRPDERKLFLEAPLNTTFGPVKTANGFLFGRVVRRILAGNMDSAFSALKGRVESDYRREWSRQIIAQIEQETSVSLQPQVFLYDPAAGQPGAQPAYRLSGCAVTFDAARSRFPNRIGNLRDPRFWNAIGKYSLLADLDVASTSGRAIMHSEDFQGLKNAVLATAELKKAVDKTLGDSEPQESELKAFAAAHRSDYAAPDRVTGLEVACENTGDDASEGIARLRKLRDESNHGYAGTTATCALEKMASAQRLLVSPIEGKPLSGLPREVQVAVQNLELGKNSELFTLEGRVAFVQMTAVQPGKMPEWNSIRTRVAGDYRTSRFQQLWKKALGM